MRQIQTSPFWWHREKKGENTERACSCQRKLKRSEHWNNFVFVAVCCCMAWTIPPGGIETVSHRPLRLRSGRLQLNLQNYFCLQASLFKDAHVVLSKTRQCPQQQDLNRFAAHNISLVLCKERNKGRFGRTPTFKSQGQSVATYCSSQVLVGDGFVYSRFQPLLWHVSQISRLNLSCFFFPTIPTHRKTKFKPTFGPILL